jgi:hypothetical protein
LLLKSFHGLFDPLTGKVNGLSNAPGNNENHGTEMFYLPFRERLERAR